MPPMPRLVEYSVSLYRLLLCAYPAAFRHEYGDAMVQLFRDTARDAYRRRGLLGLLAVWLRTLTDFTISVIRQHRDKPVEVSSESLLLRDLLHKWRRLGTDALFVTVFSAWYVLHLLRLYFRQSALVWATLTAITFGTWFATLFDSFNWLWERKTRVDIVGGTVQIVHGYDVGGAIPDEQYLRDGRAWVERNPSLVQRFASPARPWEYSFVSDIPEGTIIQWRTDEDGPARDRRRRNVRQVPALIQPYKIWRLRIPFGFLPAFLLIGTIRVYLRRKASSTAAMQSV